ncbi:hypothetical protein OGAPHI_006248 [Ogataea philodendri]|uniref:Exocyst complex component Sec3 PIP2-binding N-terminal domain-containing protein n=1 Tax=Ogataea philodendri TaxID=1378263 RepID=A0A9P8NZH4_9ASCO|nr:uncharacterized protein OGAPHI_006248 [Ogataea philodendri]KAH3662067.1 hypothetical protein OGAPHI_006248 [Ogataea philodendri]
MSRAPPVKGHQKTSSHSSIDLARQYELDISRINKYLFREVDQSGHRSERYLAHVRVIEDSKSQSVRPPDNSPARNKKDRILILSVRSSGRIRLHKARENPDTSVQIGRTWDFEELTKIELDPVIPTGFIFEMTKNYFWETGSPKERRVWITSVLEHYIRYTRGKKLPQLVNCSVEYFHLGPLLQKYGPQAPSRSATAESNGSGSSGIRTATSATTPTTHSSPSKSFGPPSSAPTMLDKSDPRSREVQRAASALKGVDRDQERRDRELKERQTREREAKERERKERERKELEARELQRREYERQQAAIREKERQEAEKRERQRQEAARQERELQLQREAEDKAREQERLEQERREAEQTEALRTLNSNTGTISARSIEFVGHHRSMQEVEDYTQDDDEYDAVFDDYADREPETAPLNFGPSPSIPEKPEIVIDSSKVSSPVPYNVSNVEKFVPEFSDSEDDQERDTTIELLRPHARSRAFSTNGSGDRKTGDLSELLDEIGWDPKLDDSKSLQKKLLKELERIQFQRIDSLTDVVDSTSSVSQAISKSLRECETIDPILSFYGVQLASFQDEVDHIEKQGHGIQVEATNKKLLKKELDDILHSVDISDRELSLLLNERISTGQQNGALETVLTSLYAALTKIRGDDSDDEEMGQMRALEEKKSKYEKATQLFINNLKKYVDQLFAASVTSLNSKLQTDKTLESIRPSMERKLSELMTLQGLIAFVKQVSPSDYKEILASHQNAFAQFYVNLVTVLTEKFNSEQQSVKHVKFSFANEPKDLITHRSKRPKSSAGSRKPTSNMKILEELGFGASSQTTILTSPEPAEKDTRGSLLLEVLRLFFDSLILHQRFVIQFFSLSSSEEYNFSNLTKKPLASRVQEFTEPTTSPMEADRDVSDQIFNVMHMIVGNSENGLLKFLMNTIKQDMLQYPITALFTQKLAHELSSTSQEYVVNMLTRTESKLSLIWTRHLDSQLHIIEEEPAALKVYKFVKAFPEFVRRIDESLELNGVTNIADYSVHTQLVQDYERLWSAINSSLNKNAQLTSHIDQALVRSTTLESSRLDLTQTISSTGDGAGNHLSLLLNYNWLSGEMKQLATLPQSIKTNIEELKSKELNDFCDTYARTTSIGELMSALEGIDGLVKSHTNPSRTNAYSTANMSKLLSRYEASKLKVSIKEIATELSSQITGKMTSDEESEVSSSIAKDMEKELFNNCLNSLSIIYNVNFSKLNQVLKEYYDTLSNPVDKIVINYNFSKEYL